MNAPKYVYPNPEGSREPVTIEEMAGLNTLTPLEQDMRSNGFVRCPNVFNRWYAGHAGMIEPVFPLELRVTDAIWLVTRAYGQTSDIIPLMRFDSAQSLGQYLKDNHRIAQAAAAFSNSWD